MEKEDLVNGRQYFYNGEWLTFSGKDSGFISTNKAHPEFFSLEIVENLDNCWRQPDLDTFKQIICTLKTSPIKSFAEQDLDLIVKKSVSQAWNDAKRPHSGIGKFDADKKRQAKEFLERTLIAYFNNDSKDQLQFDKWHKETCDKLLTFFEGYVRSRKGIPSANGIGFTYGSAQKWINMSFKYIYFFDLVQNNYSTYIGYFKNCHLAIDQFTADWLETFSPVPVVAYIGFSLITDYDAYLDAQKAARIKCQDAEWSKYGTYLIEKEVMIWEKYKNIARGLANNNER